MIFTPDAPHCYCGSAPGQVFLALCIYKAREAELSLAEGCQKIGVMGHWH